MRGGTILPKSQLAVFWALITIGLLVTWQVLPTTFSQIAYLLLFIFSIVMAVLNKGKIAGLSAMFFTLVSINYWQLGGVINPLVTGAILVLVSVVVGRCVETVEGEEKSPIIFWLILGFAIAQANAIFIQWPISFFNRALLSGITFYLFWQLMELRDTGFGRPVVGHFLFVSLAVIVVISTIIWTNFPHLAPF